jgi:hypothetical protein
VTGDEGLVPAPQYRFQIVSERQRVIEAWFEVLDDEPAAPVWSAEREHHGRAM